MHNSNTRFYRHYKNKPYRYLGTVRHSETLEELVLYETLYDNTHGKLWVRPKDMFFENVNVNNVNQARFKSIDFTYKTFDMLSESESISIFDLDQLCFEQTLNQQKFLSTLHSMPHQFHILVYEADQLVGFKLGYRRNQDRFYSWIGAVHPDYQGLGLASEMMRRQHEWCSLQKFKVIETKTKNENPKMISLNLAHGFKIVGTSLDSKKEIRILLEKNLT